jgi:DNA mismatch repair protein MutS2
MNSIETKPSSASECFAAVLSSGRSGDGERGLPSKTFTDLDWHRICAAMADRCVGLDAAGLASELGLLPNAATAARRRAEVDEATAATKRGVAPPLRGLDGVTLALARARKADILPGEDLLRISKSAHAASRVASYFSEAHGLPLLVEHGRSLANVAEVNSELARCLDPTGALLDTASPELAVLRRRVLRLRESILTRLAEIVKSPRYEGILQDDYVTIRDERYVLPVRSGEKGDFPGIVHGQSSSGHTLFIEPKELFDANNQFRIAQLDVENEERRIYRQLTSVVKRRVDDLERNHDVLVYLDLTFAAAQLAVDLRSTCPTMDTSDSPMILLKEARHPVLALRELDGELEVVPNDISLSGHALVVSGPNTGGKTITLKTVGLLVLMTRAGLTVPVETTSTVPYFDQVFSDIGDEQGVDTDLSTFSGHVANIASFQPRCGPSSLALLDELFAGTDPEQGAALGRSLLDQLTGQGAIVIVTTHLEGLKTLGVEDPRYQAASVAFDLAQLRPTYQLRDGIPGSSYALRIAARLGLEPAIVDGARELLSTGLGIDREEVIERLEKEHSALASARAEVEVARDEVRAERDKLKNQRDKLEKLSRDELDKEATKLRDEVRQLKNQVARWAKTLRKAKAPETTEQIAELRETIEGARTTARDADELANRARPKREDDEVVRPAIDIKDLSAGDTVWVRTFKRSGQLIEFDPAGRATVQLGPLRTTVALSDLRESSASEFDAMATPLSEAVRVDVDRTDDNSVDLRGARVDEAIDQLDAYLDRAARTGGVLFVVHGHGTGALKSAIRNHLRSVPYQVEWRPGGAGEGGDGVTVVTL